MRTFKQMLPLLAAIVALQLIFRFGGPYFWIDGFHWWPGIETFWGPENQIDIVQQVSVNAIIAFGMTLVILIGGIDLSVGALLALVGTTTVYVLAAGNFEAGDSALLSWTLLALGFVAALGMAAAFTAFNCLDVVRSRGARGWLMAVLFVWTLGYVLAGGFPGVHGAMRLAAAILAGVGIAAAFGAFNGVAAAKTPMPPFIITLATMLIARGCALSYNKGLPMRIPDEETVFLTLGNGRLFGVVPVPVIVMLTLFAVAAVLLHRTRFGQHLYAMGGNREAARFTGIPLVRTGIAVYVICSLLTAVAGMIHTSQLYSAEPGSGEMFELNAIAAVVVGGTSFTGGKGTMFGTLIGAIIIGILDKGLNQAGVHYSLQYIVKGSVILAAVYLDVRRRR